MKISQSLPKHHHEKLSCHRELTYLQTLLHHQTVCNSYKNFYCCVLNDQIFYNSNSFLNLAPQFFYSIKHGFSHSPPSGHSIKFESIYSILDKQVKLLKIAVFSLSTFNYKLLFKLEKIKLQRCHKSTIILSITSRVNAFVNIVSQNPMFQ